VSETMEPMEKPRGMQKRGDTWLIDKKVGGVRLCKSLDTPVLSIAVERYNREVERALRAMADSRWNRHVKAMLDDRLSWLHKTHAQLLYRGRSDGRGCTVSSSELALVVMESRGRCQVSGIEFCDEKPPGSRLAPFQMSIDRIDSKVGYHAGNCRVVCLAVNLAMREWGERVMVTIGKAMLLRELQRDLEKKSRNCVTEEKNGSGAATPNPLM
jgi:hypothetical protein